jgi:hypothetical protein
MVHRRAVITGTVLGALSAVTPPGEAAGSQGTAQASDRLVEDIAKAVRDVRDEIARQYTFWELVAVREPLRTFLKANGKFPDFIEVGSDVWQQVYDWHVRFQQPIALGRTGDGRYTILLLATNIVMRPDVAANYVGVPYDNR